MLRCVYCGKLIEDSKNNIKINNKLFTVCSTECHEKAEKYATMDKNLKKYMYLGIFVPCIFILFNLMINKNINLVYLMQTIVGIVFIVFPYPNSSIETFNHVSIKKVIFICRILGLIFLISGIYLFLNV